MTVVVSDSVRDLPECGYAWLVCAETGEIRAKFYDGIMLKATYMPEGSDDATQVI